MTKLALNLLENVVHSGKILMRVCEFSEVTPQMSPKNGVSKHLPDSHSPKRLRSSSERRKNLEMIMLTGENGAKNRKMITVLTNNMNTSSFARRRRRRQFWTRRRC